MQKRARSIPGGLEIREVLKTEGEARGFQHFPADIKIVTSLLVPFLKQYQFSNKNQFKLE